jgi:hypothetical protein
MAEAQMRERFEPRDYCEAKTKPVEQNHGYEDYR